MNTSPALKRSSPEFAAADDLDPYALDLTDIDTATAQVCNTREFDDPQELPAAIAVMAYFLSESRSFEPGHEQEDWLDAEAAVLAERIGMKGLPA